jgi:hypothetical protein
LQVKAFKSVEYMCGHSKRRFGMSKWMFVVAVLLFVVGQVRAPLTTAGEAGRASGDVPQPPPRRAYTPTPDGFERFLRECLVLSPTA